MRVPFYARVFYEFSVCVFVVSLSLFCLCFYTQQAIYKQWFLKLMRILQNIKILHVNKLTEKITWFYMVFFLVSLLGFCMFLWVVVYFSFCTKFYIAQKRRESVAKRNAKESLIVCVSVSVCLILYISMNTSFYDFVCECSQLLAL